MGFGIAFIFTIAFLGALSLVIAGDPSVLRIVGESRSRAIYGHCYLTATDADLLACVDISSGSLSWRFPIDERQVRNGKKVVSGDKVAYVLSYSTEDSGATVYSISVKDGTLLWSLPLSSGEFLGDAVDMTYSRTENALYVMLHNAFHKITTVGTEPSVNTMILNDSILPGFKLLHLIDNVGDKSPAKRGVAVGCIMGTDSLCGESAVLQLNTATGDSIDVTKMKSSSSGSNLFASDNQVFRVDVKTEGTSKLTLMLEQTSYTGSQMQSSIDVSLTSLVGSDDKISNIRSEFYRLDQTPIVHLELQVLRSNAQPQSLHFVFSTSADGKLNNFFAPHSAEDKVMVSFDHVASSSHTIRQLYVFTSESYVARTEMDGKLRVVSCKRELLGNDNMVGLWKESEKTIVAEGGSRISAFRLSSASSLSSVSHLWTRQEALAQIQQAILLPGLTMKTSSSFFGALDSICATSQLPWVKPLCGVFDQTKTLLDKVEVAFQRILPSRVPHHRHGHKGANTLTEGQDHVIAISFNGDASALARNPQPLNALNLQVHSLVFPHDLAVLKALHGGSAEKSVLMSSRRLGVSHGGKHSDVLVRSVRLLLVPQSADDEDGTVSVRVIADIVDGGIISWVTSFSLEEDMRVRNGDEYLPVLFSSNASPSTVKTLLPTEEWEIVGDLAAVMPTHIVTENATEESVTVVPLPGKGHHHLQNVKTPNFVHTVSPSQGEISIYETRSHRKVANVKFDPSMEEIVEVSFPVAEDLIYSRVSILGDDNILVKYLNPNMIVVCTATKPSSSANGQDATSSQVFVNLVDVVSGNVLQRIVLESAAAPVRAHLMENFVLISYWNPVLKRAEILTMGLFDGVIGKTDYLPFASKPNVGTREHDEKTNAKTAASSVDSVHVSAEEEDKAILLRSSFLTSIPLVMQRTYLMPSKVMDIAHTLSRHGLTNKNILLTLDSGEVYSLDFRILHPRRPMSDPTASEKEEGLMRYGPIFPLMPQMTLTMEQRLRPTGRYPTHTLSAPSYLESEALVFVFGRFNDVLFTSVTPSQGFDTLSANFNYTALVGLITLLFVAVMVLRRMHRATTLKRMWQ